MSFASRTFALAAALLVCTGAQAFDLKFAKNECDKGTGRGCLVMGVTHYFGQGVKQDYVKAAQYFRKACNAKEGRGCFNLGMAYRKGQGVKANTKEAKMYFSLSCRYGNNDGCEEASR